MFDKLFATKGFLKHIACTKVWKNKRFKALERMTDLKNNSRVTVIV
jgi:hypothetical protein